MESNLERSLSRLFMYEIVGLKQERAPRGWNIDVKFKVIYGGPIVIINSRDVRAKLDELFGCYDLRVISVPAYKGVVGDIHTNGVQVTLEFTNVERLPDEPGRGK